MPERSDEDLMLAAGRGDRAAFGVLVERHYRGMVHFAQRFLGDIARETAEDLVQDVFLKAWKTSRTFKPRAAVRTWLMRITTQYVPGPPASKPVSPGDFPGERIAIRPACCRARGRAKIIFAFRIFAFLARGRIRGQRAGGPDPPGDRAASLQAASGHRAAALSRVFLCADRRGAGGIGPGSGVAALSSPQQPAGETNLDQGGATTASFPRVGR